MAIILDPPRLKRTPRQQDVLDFVSLYVKKNGRSPTLQEIATGIGISDCKGIIVHLKALDKQGALAYQTGVHRGITLFKSDDSVAVPIIEKTVPGYGIDTIGNVVASKFVSRWIEFPKRFFRKMPDYFLRVPTDTLVDLGIDKGDCIAVTHARTAIHGDIVVAMVNVDEMSQKERNACGILSSGLALRQVVVSGKRILLKSANRKKNYAPIEFNPERVKIKGKYVGLIRTN